MDENELNPVEIIKILNTYLSLKMKSPLESLKFMIDINLSKRQYISMASGHFDRKNNLSKHFWRKDNLAR